MNRHPPARAQIDECRAQLDLQAEQEDKPARSGGGMDE